jgi:hypothetical protein
VSLFIFPGLLDYFALLLVRFIRSEDSQCSNCEICVSAELACPENIQPSYDSHFEVWTDAEILQPFASNIKLFP